MQVLDERHESVPVLRDLVEAAPDEVAMDRRDMERRRNITEDVSISLKGLLGHGRLGEMFSAPTTTPMRLIVPSCSTVEHQGHPAGAAGRGADGVLVLRLRCDQRRARAVRGRARALRHYFVILDELWRALRSVQGMVDRVDSLTRLNRQWGVGTAMISHTMSDLQALANPEDRMKARGFVERSGMVICGGLPPAEMPALTKVVAFS